MKTIFTFIIFLLINCGMQAQPSLSNANLPSDGESYTIYTNTSLSSSSTPGNAGANVYWDFSSISTTNSAALTYYTNSNVNYGNANIYFETQGTNNYFDVSNDALTYYGSSSSSFDIVYTDGQDQIRVPFNYGDQYTDSYEGSFSAFTQTYDRVGNLEVTSDGYGTLETPEGVYSNVLRVRIVRTATDYNNGTPVSDKRDTIYFWYNEMTSHPIMTYSINYVDGNESGQFANYMADSDVTVSVDKEELVNLSVYPNPASNELNITSDEVLENIHVYSTDGREIMKIKPNLKSTKLNIEKLRSGTYYLRYERFNGDVGQKIFIKR